MQLENNLSLGTLVVGKYNKYLAFQNKREFFGD
jgi:hypothetical protein